MLKYFFALASCVSAFALAADKKEEVVECWRVAVVKIETDEKGERKLLVIHPSAIKCEAVKKAEPETVPTRAPRLFPKQP